MDESMTDSGLQREVGEMKVLLERLGEDVSEIKTSMARKEDVNSLAMNQADHETRLRILERQGASANILFRHFDKLAYLVVGAAVLQLAHHFLG